MTDNTITATNNTATAGPPRDNWHDWLARKRYGGSEEQRARTMKALEEVASKIVEGADIAPGERLLDVGAGEGLVAFTAAPLLGAEGSVIVSDISDSLLDFCRTVVRETEQLPAFSFLNASADDLSAVPDASVDIVTTRSVLIYIQNKEQAFREFFRVLKPGGRVSIFEPINQFNFRTPRQENSLYGYDFTPVAPLLAKLLPILRRQDVAEMLISDPMVNFDERDLMEYALQAGFSGACIELTAFVTPPQAQGRDWSQFYSSSPNPLQPSLEDAVAQALTLEEAEEFIAYLRPLVESSKPSGRLALCYLTAYKS